MADAEAFCASHGLEEYSTLFTHAALVARDPHHFEELDEITPEEKAHLVFERDNRWALSRYLWYSSVICAVGAACVPSFVSLTCSHESVQRPGMGSDWLQRSQSVVPHRVWHCEAVRL